VNGLENAGNDARTALAQEWRDVIGAALRSPLVPMDEIDDVVLNTARQFNDLLPNVARELSLT
jgi:hypothetical protein